MNNIKNYSAVKEGRALCPAYGQNCPSLQEQPHPGELSDSLITLSRHLAKDLKGGSQCQRCKMWFGWRAKEDNHKVCHADFEQSRNITGPSGQNPDDDGEASGSGLQADRSTTPSQSTVVSETGTTKSVKRGYGEDEDEEKEVWDEDVEQPVSKRARN